MQLHFYLLLYWIYTQQKYLTMLYGSALGRKHESARYRALSFSISSGKKPDSSEAIDSQLRAGWLEAHAI